MMMQTVRDTAELHPEFVKLHLLHVLRDTALSCMYRDGRYTPLTEEHYVSLVVSALELLPPDTVIARHHNPEIVSVIIQSVRQIIEVGAVLYLLFRFGYGFWFCRSTGSCWSFC
mgnify:CR=1 FL=1